MQAALTGQLMAAVLSRRAEKRYDAESMALSAELLRRNPEVYTVWNYRCTYLSISSLTAHCMRQMPMLRLCCWIVQHVTMKEVWHCTTGCPPTKAAEPNAGRLRANAQFLAYMLQQQAGPRLPPRGPVWFQQMLAVWLEWPSAVQLVTWVEQALTSKLGGRPSHAHSIVPCPGGRRCCRCWRIPAATRPATRWRRS